MTAVDIFNDRLLPFYEEHEVEVEHLLTDNVRGFRGRELHHRFERYLAINKIKHRRTEVRSRETNGLCERFHRTVKERPYRCFPQDAYESVDPLQRDLDVYLEFYNRERCHHGYRTKGRTPYQVFLEGRKQLTQQLAV
jgi:transposase InsO family protein